MSIEITDEVRAVFRAAHNGAVQDDGYHFSEDADIRLDAGLVAVLALPEVRQAIHDDVRRETEASPRELGVTGYSVEGI